MIKVGDLVTPKRFPTLKRSKVKKINLRAGWNEADLYILENGTVYTKDELIQ